MKRLQVAMLWLLFYPSVCALAQEKAAASMDICTVPSRFFSDVLHKTADLDEQLTSQTQKYMDRMARREEHMYQKLIRKDSTGARSLFAGTSQQYRAFAQKLASDTGGTSVHISGEYQAYTDSLQSMLKFLPSSQTAGALSQLKSLEAKMQDASQIKEYIRQRRQVLSQYIEQHANLSGLLGKDVAGLKHDAYYYAQQVRQYKDMLNDPDKLIKQALAILGKMPDFQGFMKQNSQLAGLFNLPSNYGDPATLTGLQTRDQVAALIQGQLSSAGPGGAAALQSSLQSAQSQLACYKDKLSKLGSGSGDIDMPDFTPNQQKTKTFWKRLEYGTNFQTTRNNYAFPTVADLGLSMAYKLGENNLIGVGGSYKLGLGNGIQHVAFSSQGVGLRSFIDIKIKGSFSATGGFEYNHTTPFASYQGMIRWADWSKSGLIGVSKSVSLKSRVFKKTKVQLLLDFLSFQQIPRTQAVIFRVGYHF